ncbi:MAG: hypothetical protein NTX88_08265 [Candidatus Atribacteria bacterium]|nr:hypothetical protein [Candidatus Atribacteria bacterium]
MERTTFKEWMTRKEEPNRFFIIELNVSQNLWDTTYLPRVKEKFQVKQTVMIHNDRGWKENETSLRELSLFPENRLITLDGVSEDVAFCISRNRSFPPDYFFLYLPGDVLKKKWERGVIIQIEFRERDFWEWLNQKIAQEKVTFTPPARKKLYQFWLEYDIREEDLSECIQLSDRTRPIEGDGRDERPLEKHATQQL